jgi:hypothetical protein
LRHIILVASKGSDLASTDKSLSNPKTSPTTTLQKPIARCEA